MMCAVLLSVEKLRYKKKKEVQTQRSEERKRSEGRAELGWNRGGEEEEEESRGRGRGLRCFSRGLTCKMKLEKTSLSGRKNTHTDMKTT
ncbi:hypothetical protein INR49_031042 [Caranx melampygus]|nr:hypothetical protein INR49_031042 [Caranx melampygus]